MAASKGKSVGRVPAERGGFVVSDGIGRRDYVNASVSMWEDRRRTASSVSSPKVGARRSIHSVIKRRGTTMRGVQERTFGSA
jgi:hypothetical protein